ncbi:MAG: glycosyltransferase [Candidatus Aminicenantes bacterium]|nr:glycosyltransferase [Candidatus Aminicenantes bacterium]NIM77591.1 glycosyltransferase [Candidatus Aminicenantes bacterium]NIN16905.1 glycosyltransferase [Candidatus Aminicenantes bacterium]NIN40798.1 glycosyltransferase [Candidatus Aminicenantes bacterium]NIN83602.1 glycosyltransferase [Candidatus Aminicenantes bacterium]
MNEDKIDISVVIPVYKNERFIDELVSRLQVTLTTITNDFEIIFVNDGSPDNSWELIKGNAVNDPRVTGIRFARNFGQHTAITAGVDYCSGHWLVVMDGDLQDRPEEITKLYQKAREGYDVVFARRQVRKDKFFKKITSKLFYKILDRLVDGRTDPTVANFGIYSRKVVDYFKKMRERSRLFPLFIRWLGFKTAYVVVKHGERTSGKSAYNFSKKIKLALDTIISMSNKPLSLSIKLGFIIALISFLYGLILVIRYLGWGIPVLGWTSMMVSIYFLGGLLLSMAGILGLYIGKIFDEVKNRPLYVIDDIVGPPGLPEVKND